MPAYTVLKKLGEGGMGVVYLANQTSLDRQVALKLLIDTCRTNPQFYGRFLREVQASTRVVHPNIIKILDYGEIEGQPFYAMEYVAAPTLEDAYKGRGTLPVAVAVKVAEQLLAALSCMHRAGLVHRDLKPSNVMLDEREHVTLMDFGLVKDLERTQMTAQGKIVGTPGYLSPEAIVGGQMDGRADLFSLGIVLWEILVGERPFSGDSLQALLVKIVKTPHTPARERRPEVPAWFSGFIDRLLAKDPAARFPSAQAALVELKKAQGKPVRPDAADQSVDHIVDFSGELELDGPVPQGSIEGGLKALAALPTPEERRASPGSVSLPMSGVVPPQEGPPPALVTTAPMKRGTRQTRPIPRLTTTTPMVKPRQGPSPVVLAAGAGALVAILVVGAWVAFAPGPRVEPSPAPIPSPSATASVEAPAPGLSTARAAGQALLQSLDRLRSKDQIIAIHDDLMRADKRVRVWFDQRGQAPPTVLTARARWGDKLARLAKDVDLAARLAAFNWKKQEYYTAPDVPAEERLALYLRLHEMQDLVLWCRRCQVPVSIDPAPGFYEKYGQLSHSAMPDAPGVMLMFKLAEHAKDAEKLAPAPGLVAVPVPETERYFLRGDSRQEDVVGAFEDLDRQHLQFRQREPLPLPPLDEIASLEICGWVSDLAANNRFVIQIAEDEAPFRDVAVIRGNFGSLRPVSHTLERKLFRGQRLRLGVRFEATRNMIAWSEYSSFPRLGLRYRRKP